MQKVQPENRPEPSAPVSSVQPFRLRVAWLSSPVFLPRLPVSCALSFPCPVRALDGWRGGLLSAPVRSPLSLGLSACAVPLCVASSPPIPRPVLVACSEGVPSLSPARPDGLPRSPTG